MHFDTQNDPNKYDFPVLDLVVSSLFVAIWEDHDGYMLSYMYIYTT